MEIINGFIRINSIVKILDESYGSISIVIYIDYINLLVLCVTNETTTSDKNIRYDLKSPTDLILPSVSEIDNKTVKNYISNLLEYTTILGNIDNIYSKYSKGFKEDFEYRDEVGELKKDTYTTKIKDENNEEQFKISITKYTNHLKHQINNYFNPLKDYKLNIIQYTYDDYPNPDRAISKNITEFFIKVGIYINSSDKEYSNKLLSVSGYGFLIGFVDIGFTNNTEDHKDEKTIEFDPFVINFKTYNTKYGLRLTVEEYNRTEIKTKISKDFENQIPIWQNEAIQLCKETFTRFRNLKIVTNLPEPIKKES
jgi:hypothetical protein